MLKADLSAYRSPVAPRGATTISAALGGFEGAL
jgi:hypothetical protein